LIGRELLGVGVHVPGPPTHLNHFLRGKNAVRALDRERGCRLKMDDCWEQIKYLQK
jgi:hypothetical protein